MRQLKREGSERVVVWFDVKALIRRLVWQSYNVVRWLVWLCGWSLFLWTMMKRPSGHLGAVVVQYAQLDGLKADGQ